MPNAIAILLTQLDQAYDRRSWHGPNLRGSLRGLSLPQAAWRPAAARHNIWEVAVHAAYWKYAVRRRLTGEKRGSFPLVGSNFFPRPEAMTIAAWKGDLALLESTHQALRGVVATLGEKDLARTTPGGTVTVLDLVTGIAAHDLYHAGQIQLLKRLMPAST
jgi:uncharacterized damage-inducible protein DinB